MSTDIYIKSGATLSNEYHFACCLPLKSPHSHCAKLNGTHVRTQRRSSPRDQQCALNLEICEPLTLTYLLIIGSMFVSTTLLATGVCRTLLGPVLVTFNDGPRFTCPLDPQYYATVCHAISILKGHTCPRHRCLDFYFRFYRNPKIVSNYRRNDSSSGELLQHGSHQCSRILYHLSLSSHGHECMRLACPLYNYERGYTKSTPTHLCSKKLFDPFD